MLLGPQPSTSPISRKRIQTRAIICTILIIYTLYFLFFRNDNNKNKTPNSNPNTFKGGGGGGGGGEGQNEKLQEPERMAVRRKKDMIMATRKSENDDTTWLFDEFSDWHKSIYVVDDSKADLTVKKNKGRESMVYLTYITLCYN